MSRIPKRLLAFGGLAAAALWHRRRRERAAPSAPQPFEPVAGTRAPVPPSAAPPSAAPPPSTEPPHGAAEQTQEPGGAVDALVEAETAAAAAEAGAIGGPHVHDTDDPAMEPVYEAGGGEAEGFELAEAELVENATHGEGRAEPFGDAFTPEVEADRSTAVSGEADDERPANGSMSDR